MFGVTFDVWWQLSVIKEEVAILITGVVIKLMDDWLDKDRDLCSGKKTLAARLNGGLLPYTLVLLALAMAMAPGLSLSLFLGTYVTGMMGEPGRRLPTGLGSGPESILVLLLGVIGSGWWEQISSLLLMVFIQAADDLLDAGVDMNAAAGRVNLALRWGRAEAGLVAAICLLASFLLDWRKTLAVAFCAPAVLGLLGIWERENHGVGPDSEPLRGDG